MNIQAIIKMLIDAGIEENEAKAEVKILLEHFCKYTEKDKILGRTLSDSELELIKEKVEYRIKERIPVQYITEEGYFMGEFFKVSPDVLIPRDEIELIQDNDFKKVLDIGTGSGCIACTIAKNTDATVLGVDISSDALRIALDNVTRLGINNRAVFRKSDLFEKVREEEKFDIIISNPPYIPRHVELSQEVMKEPELALRANEDGLEFYRKITEKAPDFLKDGGWLMYELGIGESNAVKAFMQEHFTNVTIEKDLAGIDRIIYGKKL